MQIAIANDHAGVRLKDQIVELLKSKYNIKVINLGSNDEQRVDYPDYAHALIEEIIEERAEMGILICGTGIGMSIAAYRSSAIRAALCCNEFLAERARRHNDANVLVLGSKLQEDQAALKMVEIFLNTTFERGRHLVRLAKI